MSEGVLFLKSGRCAWGKCLFCGYGKIQEKVISKNEFKRYLHKFFNSIKIDHIDHIKVFSSGSFLDERQLPRELRKYFISECLNRGIKKVTIESRPEFVTEESIDDFDNLDLEIAMGLEIADNNILKKINKGFYLRDFERAASLIHAKGADVRTYLLVNLPFVENMENSLNTSVEYALKFSDSVVLINLLPHSNSDLFKLWIRGEWNFLSRDEFYRVTKRFASNPKIELDVETFRFVPKFPDELKENLSGVGERYLTHSHFEVWQDYLIRWYIPPTGKKFLLFLPCSYKKPYSKSETHKRIISKLKNLKNYNKIHEIMISNAGVVPREFENYYPFNSYDWDEKKETEEIKMRYIDVTKNRIKKYIQRHIKNYLKIFCFLKYDSESFIALKRACDELGMECRNLLIGDINEPKPLQTDKALNELYRGLKNEIG